MITTYTLTTRSGSVYTLEVDDWGALFSGRGSAGDLLERAELDETRIPVAGHTYTFGPGLVRTSVVLDISVEVAIG